MTDAQVMTIAFAIIFPLSMLLYSNSRITDTKETLRSEIQAMKSEMALMKAELFAELRGIRSDLKIHELEHHK